MRTRLSRLLFLALTLLGPLAHGAEPQPLMVFGAASLTDVLQKIGPLYTQRTNTPVTFSFAASSALAKQLESGAQADVFFSADEAWLDYLQERKLIKADTRFDVVGNRLALIAPTNSKVQLKLERGAPLLAALGPKGRLATGDPDSVPAGKYAKAALSNLDIWSGLESRLVRADNVRVALMYVARGEAPLGIVYSTDASVESRVKIVALFPETSHAPITYPVAATSKASAGAESFLKFLRSDAAREVFSKAGFNTLAAGGAQGTASNNAPACQGFSFDISKELQLFSSQPQPIKAGTMAATEIKAGELYSVTLNPQQQVTFTTTPGKATANDSAHAGILKLAGSRAQTIRISASDAAWLDVINEGKPLESARHTGSGSCPLLRKVVEFKIAPNTPVLLQISGSRGREIKFAVTDG